MSRSLMMAGAAAMLALAGCSSEPDPRGVDRDETVLTVSATGEAEARPDEARFSVGVQTFAGSASAATKSNREAMDTLVAELEKLGIGEDDIQTRNLSVNRITYGKRNGQFEANNIVEVRMKQVDKVGEAIGIATENGANVLNGPSFSQSDPEKASLSAYTNAYKSAEARAKAYAEAAGMEISRVLAITDGASSQGGYPPPPPPVPYAVSTQEAAAEQAIAAPVRPGVTTSQANVRVDFALRRK